MQTSSRLKSKITDQNRVYWSVIFFMRFFDFSNGNGLFCCSGYRLRNKKNQAAENPPKPQCKQATEVSRDPLIPAPPASTPHSALCAPRAIRSSPFCTPPSPTDNACGIRTRSAGQSARANRLPAECAGDCHAGQSTAQQTSASAYTGAADGRTPRPCRPLPPSDPDTSRPRGRKCTE